VIRLTFEGLEALKANLRELPAVLAEEGGQIVRAHAEAAERAVVAAYPEVTGNLKGHVVLEEGTKASQFGASLVLKSTAKHAYLFEVGTAARQTDLGYDRGAVEKAVPPGRVFVPIVIRERRAMEEELAELVERQGLEVRHAA